MAQESHWLKVFVRSFVTGLSLMAVFIASVAKAEDVVSNGAALERATSEAPKANTVEELMKQYQRPNPSKPKQFDPAKPEQFQEFAKKFYGQCESYLSNENVWNEVEIVNSPRAYTTQFWKKQSAWAMKHPDQPLNMPAPEFLPQLEEIFKRLTALSTVKFLNATHRQALESALARVRKLRESQKPGYMDVLVESVVYSRLMMLAQLKVRTWGQFWSTARKNKWITETTPEGAFALLEPYFKVPASSVTERVIPVRDMSAYRVLPLVPIFVGMGYLDTTVAAQFISPLDLGEGEDNEDVPWSKIDYAGGLDRDLRHAMTNGSPSQLDPNTTDVVDFAEEMRSAVQRLDTVKRAAVTLFLYECMYVRPSSDRRNMEALRNCVSYIGVDVEANMKARVYGRENDFSKDLKSGYVNPRKWLLDIINNGYI